MAPRTKAPLAILAAVMLVIPPVTVCAFEGGPGAAGEPKAAPRVAHESGVREIATTIWFQGFLADSGTGEPLSGSYDIVARMYGSELGSDLIWGPETHNGSTLTEGWFHLELGSMSILPNFREPPYYLELTVNGETMTPRQKLASVPMSFHANDADEMDLDWGLSAGGDVYRFSGAVGIGTASPERDLHIDRTADDFVGIRISNSMDGASSIEGFVFEDEHGDQAYITCYDDLGVYDEALVIANSRPTNGHIRLRTNYAERMIIEQDGDVGINTLTPSAKLDVNGTIETAGLRLTASPTAGYVLACDASGNGSWQPPGPLTLPYAGTASSSGTVFQVTQSGNGGCSRFVTTSVASAVSGVYSEYYGTAAAVRGAAMGPFGNSGMFTTLDASNAHAALLTTTDGTGAALMATSANLNTVKVENSYPHIETDIVTVEYAGVASNHDVVGIKCDVTPNDFYGVGGYFESGYLALYGGVHPTGSHTYIGTEGYVQGGSGTNYGLYGYAYGAGTNRGVFAQAAGGTDNTAGYFHGDAVITGNCDAGSYSLKRDHPLAPESRYLTQWALESPEMATVVNGNAVLDGTGEATVELPEWFVATTEDHRYQLTCIGGFAPVHVGSEISGGSFVIAGGEPGMKVSWQVTGVRNDAIASAHRRPVETDKPAEHQGKYLNPEAYGKAQTASVTFDPEVEAKHARIREARSSRGEGRTESASGVEPAAEE